MKSTMQETPLLISRLLTVGTTVHADQEVVTWTADGARRTSYRDVGIQAAQLAHALRGLGIDGDQRVATFMWNNAEHLVSYLAVPSMGAVLHALNIRLFPEQIIYITNHAENQVVILDNSLAGPFSQLLPHLTTLRHVIVNGPIPDETRAALEAAPQIEGVHDWHTLLAAQPQTFDWPELDERLASSMCYTSGTTGNPKGVVYSHRSNYLHAMQVILGMDFSQGDRLLAVVPMFHANAWGLPYAALMSGSSLIMPDRFLQAEPLARMIETERVTGGGAVPTIWNDLLRYLDEHPDRHLLRALGRRRWRRVPAGADAGDAGAARHHGDPRLGHDRDVAARHDGGPAGRDHGRGALALPRDPGADRPRRAGPPGRAGRRRAAVGRQQRG